VTLRQQAVKQQVPYVEPVNLPNQAGSLKIIPSPSGDLKGASSDKAGPILLTPATESSELRELCNCPTSPLITLQAIIEVGACFVFDLLGLVKGCIQNSDRVEIDRVQRAKLCKFDGYKSL
jgi:hypothetical protein